MPGAGGEPGRAPTGPAELVAHVEPELRARGAQGVPAPHVRPAAPAGGAAVADPQGAAQAAGPARVATAAAGAAPPAAPGPRPRGAHGARTLERREPHTSRLVPAPALAGAARAAGPQGLALGPADAAAERGACEDAAEHPRAPDLRGAVLFWGATWGSAGAPGARGRPPPAPTRRPTPAAAWPVARAAL